MENTVDNDLCTACLCVGRKLSYLGETGFNTLFNQILSEIPIYDTSHITVRVCWECRAMMKRMQTFKQDVKNSYRTLLQYLHQNQNEKNNINISKPPRLKTHSVFTDNFPVNDISGQDNDVKVEHVKVDITAKFDSEKFDINVKHEPNEVPIEHNLFEFDNYSEPDTFAEVTNIQTDIQSEMQDDIQDVKEIKVKREKKKVKKVLKKPKKEKLKVKKVSVRKSIKRKLDKVESDSEEKSENQSSDGLSDLDSVLDFYEDDPVKIPKGKKLKTLIKPLYDPTEVKLITLTHDEMLAERKKESQAEYFVKCPHRCEDCIVGFKFERTLITHMETKHSEAAGLYECPICKVRFLDKEHLKEHSGTHLKCYKCLICGKKMADLSAILKHAKNHKEYKCHVCGEVSGSLSRHQSHMTKEHREKPECVECGKFFSSRKTYRYHINVIHKGKNRFPCPHCGKIYQWKSNLWRHIKNHKARDNGELFCSPCDKAFSSVATYQQHLKLSRKHVTENEFNYVCVECNKRFANKTRLKDHVDWDHLKKVNYKCTLCDKPFKSNTSLYVHTQNVHKNKDEKDNLCHVCGKSYQNIAKLKYHIVAMHTAETPYNCEHCPSAFSWYSSLYRHIKEVHEKVRLKKKRKTKKKDETVLDSHVNMQPLYPVEHLTTL